MSKRISDKKLAANRANLAGRRQTDEVAPKEREVDLWEMRGGTLWVRLPHHFFLPLRGPKAHPNRPRKAMVCPTLQPRLSRVVPCRLFPIVRVGRAAAR